jgi:hypothetical protein
VDAPEVEDAAAMAIRENTPDYIAMAFPKLFPHGTGDFHDDQGGRTASNSPYRLLTFAQWGRFVMTWHDGRFARHSRFRYWLVVTKRPEVTCSRCGNMKDRSSGFAASQLLKNGLVRAVCKGCAATYLHRVGRPSAAARSLKRPAAAAAADASSREADRETTLTAVRRDGRALRNASAACQHDKEIVLAAVQQNGLSLQYASAALRTDRDVVLAAAKQNWRSLHHTTQKGIDMWFATAHRCNFGCKACVTFCDRSGVRRRTVFP